MKKLVSESVNTFIKGKEPYKNLQVGMRAKGLLPSLSVLEIGKTYKCHIDGDFGRENFSGYIIDRDDDDPRSVEFSVKDENDDEIRTEQRDIQNVLACNPKNLSPEQFEFAKTLNYEKMNDEAFYNENQEMMDAIDEEIYSWIYDVHTKKLETVIGYQIFIEY